MAKTGVKELPMGCMSRRGVCHLDLHPGNLLVSHDEQLVIADWGCAKIFEKEKAFAQGASLKLGWLLWTVASCSIQKHDLLAPAAQKSAFPGLPSFQGNCKWPTSGLCLRGEAVRKTILGTCKPPVLHAALNAEFHHDQFSCQSAARDRV